MWMDLVEGALGLSLIFFLPGFGITRALFPEQRVMRPLSLRTLVEQVTLSIMLSLVVVVLVGFLWLGTSTGVQAHWSEPLVEASLGAVTITALAVALARGAFSRSPPPAPLRVEEPGHEGPMDLIRALEALAREERRIQHLIRASKGDPAEKVELERDLEVVHAEAGRLRSRREADYAG